MKKAMVILISLFSFVDVVFASSYVIMDVNSGRILSSSNENEKMLIASTTKIMTAIIALENGDLFDTFTAGNEILEVYGSMIYLNIGEKITLRDLLYGLMLQSGNDASMVIATNIFGYEEFVNKMNEKARTLGMKNSIFENPHGLDDDSKNYSTAKDLAILMQYAIKNKEFMNITGTKKHTAKTSVKTHVWYNKNKLLSSYKYSTSGKIGYTTKSNHVFVSSASKGEEDLIVVTIKESDRFNKHKSLYEYYFNEYDSYKILDKYTFALKEKHYKKYHLYIKNDFYMMLNEKEKSKLKFKIYITKNIKVKNEIEIGYIDILLNGQSIHKEKIYAISKQSKIQKIKNWLFFWK